MPEGVRQESGRVPQGIRHRCRLVERGIASTEASVAAARSRWADRAASAQLDGLRSLSNSGRLGVVTEGFRLRVAGAKMATSEVKPVGSREQVMGWKRDPEKLRRHIEEAKGFWGVATGDEPAGLEDLVGRPFQPPEGPPVTYPRQEMPTSPGDDRSDVLFRLQQLAQLYEAGVLTQAEFTQAKSRVLSGG